MQKCVKPKDILYIKNYNAIINGKNFYDEPISCDIKRYEEIRRLASGQGGSYTTGCILGYDYINNQYSLVKLDADLKAIQHIEFVGQLKILMV